MGIDVIDQAILRELQTDGRVSWRELGERVGLSAPAARDRVKAMEQDGVITGYQVQVDPVKIGLPIRAIIRLSETSGAWSDGRGATRRSDGQGRDATRLDEVVPDIPEIIECHRVTGAESHVMRALFSSTGHLEEILESVWPYASSVTNIVTSTTVPRRPPPVSHSSAPGG